MIRSRLNTLLAAALGLVATAHSATAESAQVTRFPADRSKNVNPDTHLVLTFPETPTLGASGQIRIYDAANDRLVDVLDLGIPPGPTTRADAAAQAAPYTPTPYVYGSGPRATNANTKPGTPSGVSRTRLPGFQMTIIGGFTDAFHFYPVIVRDKTATIYPHNNLLEYGRTYYVQVDPGVLGSSAAFKGITGKKGWTFSTRKSPPRAGLNWYVVDASGAGDFNTVQGALDFVPDENRQRVTIFIRNGTYEEIVYFRNKSGITLLGEDRDRTIVQYANNEVFNPHPPDVSTNEWPGTFPSRRAAFTGDQAKDVHLVNLTIQTTAKGQAEGLLLTGEQNIVTRTTVVGSGDALQVNGSAYFSDCRITGDGDTILGRGAAFFERCVLESRGPFMWIRNTAANHGNVFVNSRFKSLSGESDFARAPTNRGRSYPNAEAVMIDCALDGISARGFGDIGGDASAIRFWEFNSTNASDGSPVDASKRNPASRRLDAVKDADVIANYRSPAFVLGGWTPAMAPIILSSPEHAAAADGETVSFNVSAVAVPAPTFQWSRNSQPIAGATAPTLRIEKVGSADAGSYQVTVTNASGSLTTRPVTLRVSRGR